MKKAAVVLIVVLASCAPPANETDAAQLLEARVGEIRAAAANRDRRGAERALADLRSQTEELRRSDDLSDQKAGDILEAADDVARYLALISPPSTTPTRRPLRPTPSPTRTEPEQTQEPAPTEAPPPTREPEPTGQPEPTEQPQDGGEGPGDGGQDGLPGILRGPG